VPERGSPSIPVGQPDAGATPDSGDSVDSGVPDADGRTDAGNDAANDAAPGPTGPELTAGGIHTCARLDDGTVKCRGRNASSELGLGDTQWRGDGPGEMGAALPAVQLK
jgi:E3 ubiquitin-protein ligase HERC3